MRPLRFCMLTTFYPPWNFGGDGIQVQRLAHALADRGHAVRVVHSREGHRALGGSPRQAASEHAGVEVVGIHAGVGAFSPALTYLTGHPLLARRRLERALAGAFDVLHFHNPSLLGGPAVLGMGHGLKLYTAHEQWLLCPSHVLWKGDSVCEDPPCRGCELRARRPPQLWRSTALLERSLGHVDALIAPSRTSAELHVRFAGCTEVTELAHFVPDPGPSRSSAERPFFLFAGRLEEIKGVEGLIEAFRERGSEDLLVAGDGTLRRSLERQARHLPHIRFLGWVGPQELDRLYRQALAVIVPTLGHESFGLVAVEALARGTPAVVHDFGALGELARESEAVLAYRSPNGLQAILDRLASHAALRAELGEKARGAYLAHWTPEAHLDAYFRLIARLAERRGNREQANAALGAARREAVALST